MRKCMKNHAGQGTRKIIKRASLVYFLRYLFIFFAPEILLLRRKLPAKMIVSSFSFLECRRAKAP